MCEMYLWPYELPFTLQPRISALHMPFSTAVLAPPIGRHGTYSVAVGVLHSVAFTNTFEFSSLPFAVSEHSSRVYVVCSVFNMIAHVVGRYMFHVRN